MKQAKLQVEQELSNLKSAIHRTDNQKDKHIVGLLDELKGCKADYERERNHRL